MTPVMTTQHLLPTVAIFLAAPILFAALSLDATSRARVVRGLFVAVALILPSIIMRCPDWWIFCW